MKNIMTPKNISIVNHIADNPGGKFRIIVKVRAGFLTVVDCRDFENDRYNKNPAEIISNYKKGAVQTVEYQIPGSEMYITVWAKKGKNIIMADESILRNLTIGTVNENHYDSNIYKAQMSVPNSGKRTHADYSLIY